MAKYLLLRISVPISNFIGIGRVEGNPEKNKAGIVILALFSAVKPTKCAVDAYAQVDGVVVTLRSLAGFECAIVQSLALVLFLVLSLGPKLDG